MVALVAAAGGAAATTVAFERGWMESLMPSIAPASAGRPPQMTAGHNATQMSAAMPGHQGAGGQQLYHCGMHPWIIMDHPGNCPICHMELTPMQGGLQTQTAQAEKKIKYYWDPMLGASSISQKPGKSAMGMDLVPVYENDISGGPEVTIDPAVVQNMGVQTAVVVRGALHKTVRTVGYLEVPETGLSDITLKVNGYIDKLYADKTGMHLHKGDPLFDLYSPDLIVAEEELIAARKSVAALDSAAGEIHKQAEELLGTARRKLQLWDIADADIDAISRQDHAPKEITFRSPVEGHLEDKMVVQGSSVQAGIKLMRLEDHRTLWLEAQVYEAQLPLVLNSPRWPMPRWTRCPARQSAAKLFSSIRTWITWRAPPTCGSRWRIQTLPLSRACMRPCRFTAVRWTMRFWSRAALSSTPERAN